MSDFKVSYIDKSYGLKYLIARAFTKLEAAGLACWYRGEKLQIVSVELDSP